MQSDDLIRQAVWAFKTDVLVDDSRSGGHSGDVRLCCPTEMITLTEAVSELPRLVFGREERTIGRARPT